MIMFKILKIIFLRDIYKVLSYEVDINVTHENVIKIITYRLYVNLTLKY